MHVELADLFRCPVAHADMPLVVSALRTEHRMVLDGVLGCPGCGSEYLIVDGVIRFGHAPASDTRSGAGQGSDDGMRAAALLNATGANAKLAFIGAPLALAAAVQNVVPARCIVVDAPDVAAAASYLAIAEAPMAVVVASNAAALAAASLDGVYIARGEATDWSPAIRAGGRMVAPSDHDVPRGFIELARDADHWVAERVAEASSAPAPLVQLLRR